MALVGLKRTSVTPTVKLYGGGGGGGGGGTGVSCTGGGAETSSPVTTGAAGIAGAAGLGGGAATLGGGLATTTTVYPLNSSRSFRKETRSGDTFFSTMAHLTPSSSSNSWFLLMAMVMIYIPVLSD